MKIFVLIPVFNRLPHTKKVLECLRAQTLVSELRIIIINDGSSDGTGQFLDSQPSVIQLLGDGSLWWAGAIQRGLKYAIEKADSRDYILFLNNDTWFSEDYVERLVETSKRTGGAVGSVVHEENRDYPLVSIGPRIDINRMKVWDVLADLSASEARNPNESYCVDALSGRGTLYPVDCFKRFGGMRPFFLPHYLADYEVAMRFARAKVSLTVSTRAIVFSPAVYGNHVRNMGVWARHFSTGSSNNVIRYLFFHMMVGSPAQRLTAPLRMASIAIVRIIRAFFGRRIHNL